MQPQMRRPLRSGEPRIRAAPAHAAPPIRCDAWPRACPRGLSSIHRARADDPRRGLDARPDRQPLHSLEDGVGDLTDLLLAGEGTHGVHPGDEPPQAQRVDRSKPGRWSTRSATPAAPDRRSSPRRGAKSSSTVTQRPMTAEARSLHARGSVNTAARIGKPRMGASPSLRWVRSSSGWHLEKWIGWACQAASELLSPSTVTDG